LLDKVILFNCKLKKPSKLLINFFNTLLIIFDIYSSIVLDVNEQKKLY